MGLREEGKGRLLQDFRLHFAPKGAGLSNVAFPCAHNKLLATVSVASMAKSISNKIVHHVCVSPGTNERVCLLYANDSRSLLDRYALPVFH